MLTWPWPPAEKADLSMDNGKIKIEIPKMLTVVSNSSGIDSVYLTGRVIEK